MVGARPAHQLCGVDQPGCQPARCAPRYLPPQLNTDLQLYVLCRHCQPPQLHSAWSNHVRQLPRHKHHTAYQRDCGRGCHRARDAAHIRPLRHTGCVRHHAVQRRHGQHVGHPGARGPALATRERSGRLHLTTLSKLCPRHCTP